MNRLTWILALSLVLWSAYVQAQGRGGRGGRGGMPLATLDRDWALICFELKVGGDQLKALQLAFQDAWDQRKQLSSGMSGDPQSAMEKVGAVQGALDGAISNILSKEQFEMFESLKMRSGGGNSGGRGGGRGR